MRKKRERKKKIGKIKKIILIFCVIIFVCGISYIGIYFYNDYKNKKANENILPEIEIDVEEKEEIKIEETKTERMLQLEELQKENNEIVAWLEIEGTNINYPILQADDNDYYLTHNYKKEKVNGGSLFLDKDFDLVNGSSNYLIYGHRMKNGTMFEDLMKYRKKSFYEEHKQIKFTTNEEDCLYEILAVFYSRVYYKSEKNVFRYYFFVNAENEQEYNDFVNNAKKVSIYDTGVDAEYGEQLLTLSTCEYSQEDGRFVVVAKKVTE